MMPRRNVNDTPAPIIQRTADGTPVVMGRHTVAALGGADAANAAAVVIAHRAGDASGEEPEIVRRIRAHPAETLRLLVDVALFHSQIPDLRTFIEEGLATLPKRKGRPPKEDKLVAFQRFDTLRAHLVTIYRAAGVKAPVKAADAKAGELLGMTYSADTAARYRRRLKAERKERGFK